MAWMSWVAKEGTLWEPRPASKGRFGGLEGAPGGEGGLEGQAVGLRLSVGPGRPVVSIAMGLGETP